jgi:hypothetical protein
MASPLAPQRAEVRHPVVAGDHRLAVDQEGLRLDAERGINDGREAVGPVMAVAREAADPRAIPAHHKAVAVVLDLVNPERAGRWLRHLRRLAWCDEAGGTAHDHARRITAKPILFQFFHLCRHIGVSANSVGGVLARQNPDIVVRL